MSVFQVKAEGYDNFFTNKLQPYQLYLREGQRYSLVFDDSNDHEIGERVSLLVKSIFHFLEATYYNFFYPGNREVEQLFLKATWENEAAFSGSSCIYAIVFEPPPPPPAYADLPPPEYDQAYLYEPVYLVPSSAQGAT